MMFKFSYFILNLIQCLGSLCHPKEQLFFSRADAYFLEIVNFLFEKFCFILLYSEMRKQICQKFSFLIDDKFVDPCHCTVFLPYKCVNTWRLTDPASLYEMLLKTHSLTQQKCTKLKALIAACFIFNPRHISHWNLFLKNKLVMKLNLNIKVVRLRGVPLLR